MHWSTEPSSLHACMTPVCVYSMAHYVCLFNIRNIELHTLHLNRVLVLLSSETVHDLGVGERHLAISLYKLKAN